MNIDLYNSNSKPISRQLLNDFASSRSKFVVNSDTSLSLVALNKVVITFTGTGFGIDDDGEVTGQITSFSTYDRHTGGNPKLADVNLSAGLSVDIGALVDLANTYNGAAGDKETAISIRNEFRDLLYGTEDIYLVGSSGDDRVEGGKHNDYIETGDGYDIIIFSPGSDTIDGGADQDTLELWNKSLPASGFNVNLGSGEAYQIGQESSVTTLQMIESVNGSKYADDITGNYADNFLYGLGGDDILRGEAGDDILLGGFGADKLVGGAGNDLLQGLTGRDELRGGHGSDYLNGGSGRDHIYGGLDSDQLLGGIGADFLDGGAGDDEIHGGRGRDFLRGGSGDDLMNGGSGNDILGGGKGADTFVFDDSLNGYGHDKIRGFEVTDKIIMSVHDPSSVTYGTNAKGEIRITTDSGSVLLQGSAGLEVADLNLTIDTIL